LESEEGIGVLYKAICVFCASVAILTAKVLIINPCILCICGYFNHKVRRKEGAEGAK